MSATGSAAAPSSPSTPSPDLSMRFRRLYAIFAVVVIVVGAGAGIGGYYAGHAAAVTTSSGKTTITYFDDLSASEASVWDGKFIPEFEANHTNISVDAITDLDAETIVTDVQALEQGGDVGTTVIGEDNLVIGDLVYGNDLMNLAPIYSQIAPSTLIPSMASVVTYEKTAYSGDEYYIPLRANTPLVWYNSTTFTADHLTAPATYADLLTDAATLGPGSVMFQGGAGDDTSTELFQWMVQNGGNPIMFNDAGDFQTMSYVYNLSKYFNSGAAAATYATYSGLASGEYQFLDYQWPYVYDLFPSADLAVNGGPVTVYAGPNGTSSTEGADHLIGGDDLAIAAGSKNVWAAEQLSAFLLSEPVQREVITLLGEPAVNAAAFTGLNASLTPLYTLLESALANPVFRPPVPWIETWVADLYTAYGDILGLPTYDPATVMSDLTAAQTSLESYLTSNYGASVEAQYAAGDFGPLFPAT
jgi:trehalose transport system substrate-binding protein